MRIHSDTLTQQHVHDAVRLIPSAYAEVTRHGSRKRDHALEAKLSATAKGSGRRHGNSGQYGAMGPDTDYALMWDEWGEVISRLYMVDPAAIVGPYESADHFHWVTGNRFSPDRGTTLRPHIHRWDNQRRSAGGAYYVWECKGSRGKACTAILRSLASGHDWSEISGE